MTADAPPRCCLVRPRRGRLFVPVTSLAAQPGHAALVTSTRWPAGKTLRVAFRGGTAADRDELAGAMTEWMKWGMLGFEIVGQGDAEVRVLIDDSGQSWSYVGTDCLTVPANEPTMVIGWRDDFGRSLHEFGHVMGYPHGDQITPIPWNEAAVLAYYEGPPNNWSAAEVRAQVLDRDDPSTLTGVHWDRLSIMDYPIPAEFVLDPAFVVGFNESLSDEDKAFHAACYPGRWTPTTPAQPVTASPPVSPPTPAPPLPPVVTTPTPTTTNPSTMGPTMTAILELIQQSLAFVPGHVDLAVLGKVVIDAEFGPNGSLSLEAALAAIKANEATIFKDQLSRLAADQILGLLVKAHSL